MGNILEYLGQTKTASVHFSELQFKNRKQAVASLVVFFQDDVGR
jgi:hypothetical protein